MRSGLLYREIEQGSKQGMKNYIIFFLDKVDFEKCFALDQTSRIVIPQDFFYTYDTFLPYGLFTSSSYILATRTSSQT